MMFSTSLYWYIMGPIRGSVSVSVSVSVSPWPSI